MPDRNAVRYPSSNRLSSRVHQNSSPTTAVGQQPHDTVPEALCSSVPASMQESPLIWLRASAWLRRKHLGHLPGVCHRPYGGRASVGKTKAARKNSGTTKLANGLTRNCQRKPWFRIGTTRSTSAGLPSPKSRSTNPAGMDDSSSECRRPIPARRALPVDTLMPATG